MLYSSTFKTHAIALLKKHVIARR